MPDLDLLWTDGTLLGTGASVLSGWFNVRGAQELRISRASSGGTYAFEIDWSRDGANVDLTESVNTNDNNQASRPTAASWARLRVRNTDALNDFTAHRTNVYGWG